MSIVDQILDLCYGLKRDDARQALTELLEANAITKSPMVMADKPSGKEVPITDLGLTKIGEFNTPDGRPATIYTAPKTTHHADFDAILKERAELNRMSKDALDKALGRKP